MIASVPARRAQHAQELRPRGQPCRLRISLMDCCEHPRGRGGAKTTESVWTISPDQSRAPPEARKRSRQKTCGRRAGRMMHDGCLLFSRCPVDLKPWLRRARSFTDERRPFTDTVQ